IMVTLALQRGRQKVDAAVLVMMAGSLGFAVSFFMQAKGWGYHAYPMVALGLLAAGWAAAAGGDGQAGTSRRLRVGAMLLIALIFANGCLRFAVSIDARLVWEEVALIGPRPKILMLSAANDIGHPAVRELGGAWVSRQQARAVREVVRRAPRDATIAQATAARRAADVG